MNEEDLYELSDEELEAAFKSAKEESTQDETEVEDIEEGQPEDEMETEEVEEDEIDEDLEQPEEDSDDDLDVDDEAEDDDSEDSEEDEDEPDEDDDSDEEQPEEDDKEAEEDTSTVQNFEEKLEEFMSQKTKAKASGKEYEFTNKEKLDMFDKVFAQAQDYTKKTQAVKPWRKTIDAIESAELQHDDINLMIDVLKGDKGALSEIIKRTGVDALDLDIEGTNYTPNDYGRDESTLAVKDVIDTISRDREYDVTQRILSNEWDSNSFKEMTKTPELIELLHNDVKSGMYDKVQPIAEKLKLYDNGRQTDLDYYKLAAAEYFKEQDAIAKNAQEAEQAKLEAEKSAKASQDELKRVKEAQAKQKTVKRNASRRKAAAPTKRSAGTKKTIDYLDFDEEYEKWAREIEENH